MMSMRSWHRKERGFALGLIGLLFTAAIVCYVFYLLLRIYFKPFTQDSKSENQFILEQGIDTASYRSAINTTKDKLNTISAQQASQFSNLTDLER